MEDSSTTQWTPSSWFLVTPPQPKPGVARRPRVDALLDSAVASHAVTVVLAPPGYGKTTALAAWVEARSCPTAWLTATGHDTSERQLLSGILSALRQLARDRAELRTVLDIIPDPNNHLLMLERICDALRRLPSPVTIVIDDAHRSTPILVDAIVNVMSEHSAGNARFVVAGTRNLRAWFTTALATGGASLLGADALAMTTEEIADAADAAGNAVTTDKAASIYESTRGWPVAVRLALSMPSGSGAGAGVALPGDDLLADYIVQTVLHGLRPELVAFVLAATTCTRVTAGLAEVLSENPDAASLLNECLAQGLFIDRYIDGDNAPVYRWHEVFARHCRIANRRADESRVSELNLSAARWLSSRFPAEATVHAMRANSPEFAAQIIRENWVRLVIESQAALLNARCLALPPSFANDPEILLIRACCLDVQGDPTGAQILLSRVRSLIDAADREPDEQLRRTRAFAELFLAHDPQTLSLAADHVRMFLHTAGATDNVDTHALFLLGWVELRLRRDPVDAVRLLTAARRDADAGGHQVLAGRATANLMLAYAHGGFFTAARGLSARSAAESPRAENTEWQHYDGGIECMAQGLVEYWQNKLSAAESQFRLLLEQGGHGGSYAAMARVYLALTAAATGDARLMAEARSHLSGISAVEMHGVPWPAYRTLADAKLVAATGDWPRTLALIEPLQRTSAIPVTSVLTAEVYRKAGQLGTAMHILGTVQRPGQTSYVKASALVTAAVIAHLQGQRSLAHQYLESALAAAVPEGIARPFVADADDDSLQELLTEHAVWGTSHEGFLAVQISSGDVGTSRHHHVGASLSPRERDIFGYLRTTMTADEIAAALHVSVNTVRTHQRAIYRKLGVSSRREAVKVRV